MATISTPGVGSGIDINSIVGAYINAEKVPFEKRIEEQDKKYTSQISAYGSIRNQIDSLQASLGALAEAKTFEGMKMSLSSQTYFSASIDESADVGSFDIEVKQLATSQKITSDAFDVEAMGLTSSGRLDISLGTSSFSIVVTDTQDDGEGGTRATTLEDIKQAINDAADNPGISASIVTDDDGAHLVLNSTKLGTENTINITAYDTSGGSDVEITDGSGLGKLQFDSTDEASITTSAMNQTIAAQDAIVIIDNTLTITKSSNTIENAIAGVTLNLKKANEPDENTAVSISKDKGLIETAIKGFVEVYNKYIETSQSLQYVNVDAEITAALNGDATMRMMDRQLRSQLTSAFGTGSINVMSQFGVITNRDGSLEIDQSKLSAAVNSSSADLQSFFIGSDDSPGFAVSFKEKIKIFSGADGILSTRVNTLTGEVERLDIEKENFNERITRQEQLLYSRFNAMDAQVAQLQNTLSFVTSQLENLPGLIKKSN